MIRSLGNRIFQPCGGLLLNVEAKLVVAGEDVSARVERYGSRETVSFESLHIRSQQNYHNFSEILKILGLLNIF